jgi:hypothetical protein
VLAGDVMAGVAGSDEVESLQPCAIDPDATSRREKATRVQIAIARDSGIGLFQGLALCAEDEIRVLGRTPAVL